MTNVSVLVETAGKKGDSIVTKRVLLLLQISVRNLTDLRALALFVGLCLCIII
jgi:hypothetical protein